MDNNNAENHCWHRYGLAETGYFLHTVPEIGSKDSVPFFLHGKYVERFWIGEDSVRKDEVTIYLSSCDVMRITMELNLLSLSMEDGKVIGLHYPEVH
jgi:hypothetical protein